MTLKRNYKKLLAIIVGLALVIQYSIGAGMFTSYAEELQDDTASNKTEASVPEAKEKDPEPAPKAQETEQSQEQKEPDPKPVETQSTEQTAKPAATEVESVQDDSGNAEVPEGEVGDPEGEEGGDLDGGSVTDTDEPTEDAVPGEEQPSEDVIPGEDEEIGEDVDDEDSDEDEDEDEDEDDKYPEVTLSATTGGVTVVLYAPEGALPEGAKLNASIVTAEKYINAVAEQLATEGKVLTDAVAVDITPTDKNGKPVQPKKAVSVTIKNTNLDVATGGDVDVFRVSDSATSVTEMGTSVATADKQQFDTGHFTIYVSGASASDPNGDGSNQPNSTSHRLVLEYPDSVTLVSSITGNQGRYGDWQVTAGGNYTHFDAATKLLTNNNTSRSEQNVTVRHRYGNINWDWTWSSEYFYVKVMPIKYKVTFNVQNPGGSGFDPYGDELEVYNGSTFTAPDMPEVEDYTFYGWYTDEECTKKAVESDFRIADGDKAFYGKYTTEATISYRKNTSDPATIPNPVTSGIGVGVQLGEASCSGYVLVEWNTASNGEGDSYQPGQMVEMPEGGMVLYAIWDRDKVVMRYYENYPGSGSDAWRSIGQGIYKNSRTRLTTEIPTRPSTATSSYLFRGWATRSNADNPSYYPGDTFTTGDANIINLYAIWGSVSYN